MENLFEFSSLGLYALKSRRATNYDRYFHFPMMRIEVLYEQSSIKVACDAESSAGSSASSTDQIIGYMFKAGMEFDVCCFLVFLGTLVALTPRKQLHRPFALILDILSSFYLLYSTYNRNLYILRTEITRWTREICKAQDLAFVYNYILISVVSWMASSFLEYSSSLRLVNLYKVKVKRFLARFSRIRWSQGRMVVLATTMFCTGNSLLLTFLLWESVHKSLGNAAQDVTVLMILTIAAFLRLIRQFMEGLTLIVGIASREYEWRASSSKFLFGRTAFSSLVLLISSSSLTYNFANQDQKAWGVTQYTIFTGFCIDVFFRLFVCGWAMFNSCCFSKLTLIVTENCTRVPCICRHIQDTVVSMVAHREIRQDLISRRQIDLEEHEAFLEPYQEMRKYHHTQEKLINPRTAFIPHPNTFSLTTPRRRFSRQNAPITSVSGDDTHVQDAPGYADPVTVGGPFPLLRLEIKCKQEQQ